MNCPRCGHENLEGARFCSNCGNQLEIVCPTCSEKSATGAKFCWNCGTALATDRAGGPGEDLTRYVPPEQVSRLRSAGADDPMRSERRTVTMLFADIEGSTAAAENLDPEDWADIINGAFEHLIAPVYRYEGTLARLQGDAVLAFFGAPIAHEDDPIRAVHAGLDIIESLKPYQSEILERWGVSIQVRVGINTGLVVVGEVGSDLRVEYTAMGDAVNVAARMEQTAEPGTLRVTAETWAMVSDQFEGEDIGPVEVKGKSEPVYAVRVVKVGGPIVEQAYHIPILGRAEELSRLEQVADRVVSGSGWLTSIMGEAGMGKTRLLREFRNNTVTKRSTASAWGQDGELSWMTALSRSYDEAIPYATFRNLLERWWRFDLVDDTWQRVEEVVGTLSIDGVPDPELYLGHVAEAALPDRATRIIDSLQSPELQKRVRQSLVAYIEAEARRRPLVVTFEDLHWADAMTLALVEDMMELAEMAPIGLIFTMRPYRDDTAWHIHEVAEREHPHRYEPINLVSLPADIVKQLLDEFLDDVDLAESTRNEILQRSDGNPLFIEQTVRTIRDSASGSDVTVPSGISSLLTARLDRLDPESRTVAQVASVVGSEFDRPTLAALVGNDMDMGRRISDLLRREIFVEQTDTPGMLGFHHALMQDAAYSTMLLKTRRQLHHEVAEYLIASDTESVEDIARHFVEAGDMEAAFPHLISAAEKAARSMALSEAIRLYTTALENIPAGADPDLVVRAHDGLGVAYTLVPDLTRSEATYQRLVDYADAAGRPSGKVKALNQLAMNTAIISGDLEEARRYLDEAYAVATEVGDDFGLAEYHMNACAIAGLAGDLRSSAHHDLETIRTGQNLGSTEVRNIGLYRLAESTAWLLERNRAGPAVDEALEAAREAEDEWAVARLRGLVLSQLKLSDGDTEEALRLALDSEGTLVRYGDHEAPIVQWLTGVLQYERGDVEAGISRIADVQRAAIESDVPTFVAMASATLARVYASVGVTARVAELRSTALESVEAPMGGYLASSVWADLGYANLALRRSAEADSDFRMGRGVSSTTQYWERPRLLVGRALALVGEGNHDEAHTCIDQAETFVMEKGVHFYDAHLAHARGEALLDAGKAEEAAAKLSRAVTAANDMGLRVLGVRIAETAARAFRAAGDPETAAEHSARAKADVEAMAGSIVNAELRQSLESAWLAPLESPAG